MLAARLPLRTAASLRRAGAPRALCSKAVGESIADNTKASTFTGTPASLLGKRIVKIFQPPQGVQNGNQNTTVWRMQWEDEYTKRWTNPLMGWTSTSDPLSNTHMTLEFHTAEDAVRFAEENGAPRGWVAGADVGVATRCYALCSRSPSHHSVLAVVPSPLVPFTPLH